MTANELRVGNYLKGKKEPVVVSEIRGNNWVKIHGNSSMFLLGNCFQPIPLTEEYLLSFGFKKVKSDYEEAETWDFYFGILYFDMANNSVKINGQYCLYNIPEYVHQLQNLYFALTGEELTLQQ